MKKYKTRLIDESKLRNWKVVDYLDLSTKGHTTHTNFTAEITGSYHNDKTNWPVIANVTIGAISGATILIIGELTGFTSWLFGTV